MITGNLYVTMPGRVSPSRSTTFFFFYQRRTIFFWWPSFVQSTRHVSLKVSQFSSCSQSKATSHTIAYWMPLLCLYSQQDSELVGAVYRIHFWLIISPFMYFLYNRRTSEANWMCTNAFELSFSREADSLSLLHAIHRILCNPKIRYHVRKSPPLVPTVSQTNPAHNLTAHFFMNHLNIVLPSFPSCFRTKTLCALPSPLVSK
jgi:hypothetical protein